MSINFDSVVGWLNIEQSVFDLHDEIIGIAVNLTAGVDSCIGIECSIIAPYIIHITGNTVLHSENTINISPGNNQITIQTMYLLALSYHINLKAFISNTLLFYLSHLNLYQ
ncbi:hypothetical protein Q4493_14685 [Colwellia sp. 1_MG-2023]|uniref:hypothetical protein n=1 Tax=Colwellia sp. 1_MG-2023 TaxID=3062649 RepID=UPI0026E3B350|nr:hypothetical protein [Colwellia sp. 1_MG-2023]MDO6447015.1 hypothetical protein [Colwellia sp. 1_MG-2023]